MSIRLFLDPFVRYIFAKRLSRLALKRKRYATVTDTADIQEFQLEAFNRQWQRALTRYSFYRQWKQKNNLPDRISSLVDLDSFPVLRKSDLQVYADSITADAAPCRWVTSGGSTGQPFSFPISVDDADEFYANMYLGRSWWGVVPLQPFFMLWGHSHLFGSGTMGRIKVLQRLLFDAMINTKRLNAYRLGSEEVASYFSQMDRYPDAAILSYASAFAKILDYLEESNTIPAYSKNRRIILTSEYVFPQDLARIRRLFRIEPIIEYGAAETGVIAYSDGRAENLRSFWDSFVCQVIQNGQLVLTTLWDRHFPLIRYLIGDKIRILEDSPSGHVFNFSEVMGRTNDILTLSLVGDRNVTVHSSFFHSIIKLLPGVTSFLIIQSGQAVKFKLRLRDKEELGRCRREALRMIRLEFPELRGELLTFDILEEELYTIAGKRKYIINESSNG